MMPCISDADVNEPADQDTADPTEEPERTTHDAGDL